MRGILGRAKGGEGKLKEAESEERRSIMGRKAGGGLCGCWGGALWEEIEREKFCSSQALRRREKGEGKERGFGFCLLL